MEATASTFLGQRVQAPTAVSLPSRQPSRPSPIVCKESRIGKMPVIVPAGVTYKLDGQTLAVKGPLGELTRTFPDKVELKEEAGAIKVSRRDDTRSARELHGLCRTLTDNMVVGVSKGFTKKLILTGVGYRAAVTGRALTLSLGFSHPVVMDPPEGVSVKVDNNTEVTITGRDAEVVGNFAAVVRAKRPPEPYKGKGVAYVGEKILRKEGKTGKSKK